MSLLSLVIMVLGLLPLVLYFKRKIYWANRAIEIGTIPNSTFPKLPTVRKAEQDKFNYQAVGGLTLFSYVLAFLNFNLEFTSGWLILMVIGFSISLSTYLLNTPSINYEEEADNQISKMQRLLKVEEAKKISISILVVTVGLSGNWAYQTSKKAAAEREAGIQEALSLTGTGWCSNFQDIKVYDGGTDVVKTGGWPCIEIGSVDRITFPTDEKEPKMCIWVNLNRENGPPGEESFQNSYERLEVCASTSWYNNWTESSFSDLIYEKAKPELDALQVSLCQYYGYRMGEENYSTYC